MTTDSAGRSLGNHVRRRSFLRSGAGALPGGLLAGCLTDPTVSTSSDTGTGTPSRSRSDTPGTVVPATLSRPPSLEWVRWYESNPGGSGTPSPGPIVEVVAAATTPDGGYALAAGDVFAKFEASPTPTERGSTPTTSGEPSGSP